LSNYLVESSILLNEYYDPYDEDSVLTYAKKILGKTLRPYLSKEQLEYCLSSKSKGSFGNVLEEAYFKVRNNSESRPDIPETGIEIKSGQLKLVSKNHLVFKERMKISMIDYMNGFEADSLTESQLWTKLEKILLLLFLQNENLRIDQECKWVDLLQWNDEDIKQMSEDWSIIKRTINEGRANQLSEGSTWYLGACTAGANSIVRRSAPGGVTDAKVRAFSLKPSYLNYKLGLVSKPKAPKVVFKTSIGVTLEDYLLDNIKGYFGKSLNEIAISIKRSSLISTFPKNINSKIARALLEEIASIRTATLNTEFEQFRKGGVIEKTVTLESSGKLRESISFPAFKWNELDKEDEWEDSDLYALLTTKFFFTVAQKTNTSMPILIGCFFWTMPPEDLEQMKNLWLDTKQKIRIGEYGKFFKKSDNPVGHVRPHAANAEDTFPTPQGDKETKKSFWLNNNYILEIINRELRL
jgi:DNA mismatch repair protein MutH